MVKSGLIVTACPTCGERRPHLLERAGSPSEFALRCVVCDQKRQFNVETSAEVNDRTTRK
jgi:hypothetical protein